MTLTEQDICNLVLESVRKILSEGRQVLINRKNWDRLNYADGERVLEFTPNSIMICSDNCNFRIIATKRYEHPNSMNPSNGWYGNYWKFLGWSLNVMEYRNGTWKKFDNSFPRMLKNKEKEIHTDIQMHKYTNSQ